MKSDVSDEIVNVYLQRPLAGIVTRALFMTPVTPNQLTIVAALLGIAGGVLLSLQSAHLTAAALCFYLKDIFDSADGQLARAKHLYSRSGRFLDSIGDYIVDLFLFCGIFALLLRSGVQFQYALLIGIAGFLGINLRVSYHVFYQTSYLHWKKEYQTNRITEELREEDYHQGAATIRLQKIFYFLYGWQDRLMHRVDSWCLKGININDESVMAKWYQDTAGLLLGGFLGFGTEFVLLTGCLLFNNIRMYLFFTIIVLNCVWFSAILYRKIFLAGKISVAIKRKK
ncbi:MAG: CDP-alcohol phosphatidyltransferase family protein [Bacteroidota bacterium]